MLLTASQVSVILTSGIVVLCTAALFISGYTIQQRTLRDLREAIRQPTIPRPKPKVYDEFGHVLSGVKDRTTLEVETLLRASDGDNNSVPPEGDDGFVVVVRPTIPDAGAEMPAQKPAVEVLSREQVPLRPAERNEQKVLHADAIEARQEEGEEEEEEEEEAISSAERRRRIKAEIRRLSQGESPVYYQRRLW